MTEPQGRNRRMPEPHRPGATRFAQNRAVLRTMSESSSQARDTLESRAAGFKEIADRLRGLSVTGPAYLVGGSLRDRLLNRRSCDYDFAVPGDARGQAEKAAVGLGCRVIEIGKGEKVVYRVVSNDTVLDFSPMYGNSIEDDLRRRDFTVNSIGLDLATGEMIDPAGGLADIRSKTVRLISEDAVLADPLRMLRAFRIGAVLGFKIGPETLSIIAKHAGLISGLPGERTRAELLEMMKAERSFPYIEQMIGSGILARVIPGLEPCAGCRSDQGDQQGQGLLYHLIRAYDEIERLMAGHATAWPGYAEEIGGYLESKGRKALLKLAALLHDIGKPATRSVDESGRLRFLAHAKKGADMVEGVCSALRMSVKERSFVDLVVRNHMHPLLLYDARRRGSLKTKGIVRFATRYQDDLVGLLLHSVADQRAKTGHNIKADKALLRFLDEILKKYFIEIRPRIRGEGLITGRDLIEHFGLTPSVIFARLLKKVEEARVNREIETRKDALDLVARLLQSC